METREQIIEKVKQYLVEVLEPPRPELSGFAACPFVKSERISDRIMYEIIDGKKSFVDLVKQFDKSKYTTAIFVQTLAPGEAMTQEEGSEYQQFLNAVLKQNGLGKYKNICFNPEQRQNVDGFCPRSLAPYFIVNVAPRKDLARAHKALMKTGYFSNFPKEYREYLNLE